jgi:hypothetical protein
MFHDTLHVLGLFLYQDTLDHPGHPLHIGTDLHRGRTLHWHGINERQEFDTCSKKNNILNNLFSSKGTESKRGFYLILEILSIY